MRTITAMLLLIPLISSCTGVGFIVDQISHKKEQKRSDSIRESGQEINLQIEEDSVISATFTGFSYRTDPENEVGTFEGNSFPQPGDSIRISLENGNDLYGTFAGLMHTEKRNELIMKPSWSRYKLKYYPVQNIGSLENPVSELTLNRPAEDRIIIHYTTDSIPFTVDLSDVRHLNKRDIKKRYTGTFIGLAVDTIVVLLTINQVRSMSFDGIVK